MGLAGDAGGVWLPARVFDRHAAYPGRRVAALPPRPSLLPDRFPLGSRHPRSGLSDDGQLGHFLLRCLPVAHGGRAAVAAVGSCLGHGDPGLSHGLFLCVCRLYVPYGRAALRTPGRLVGLGLGRHDADEPAVRHALLPGDSRAGVRCDGDLLPRARAAGGVGADDGGLGDDEVADGRRPGAAAGGRGPVDDGADGAAAAPANASGRRGRAGRHVARHALAVSGV